MRNDQIPLMTRSKFPYRKKSMDRATMHEPTNKSIMLKAICHCLCEQWQWVAVAVVVVPGVVLEVTVAMIILNASRPKINCVLLVASSLIDRPSQVRDEGCTQRLYDMYRSKRTIKSSKRRPSSKLEQRAKDLSFLIPIYSLHYKSTIFYITKSLTSCEIFEMDNIKRRWKVTIILMEVNI